VTIAATTPASEPNVNGVFTVTRTGDIGAALTVNYTVGGTAAAGSDYVALSGSVTIPAGSATGTITVPVLDDDLAEGPETVIVTLTPNVPVYTVKNPSQATLTIADDDNAGFIVSPISNNTSENGATATFSVTLASQPKAPVTIPVTTSNPGEGLVSSLGSPVAGVTLNSTSRPRTGTFPRS
jgi:hypothetical protein